MNPTKAKRGSEAATAMYPVWHAPRPFSLRSEDKFWTKSLSMKRSLNTTVGEMASNRKKKLISNFSI